MAMSVVVFANNQTLVTVQGTPTTIFTDPVPLNGNDRLSAMLDVHSIVKGGTVTTGTLVYLAQISNDGGQNYVDSTTVTDTTTATGVRQIVGTVNGALVRFKFTYTASGGSSGDFSGCCFDLHVNMDHV
jgi:hypothetical protein